MAVPSTDPQILLRLDGYSPDSLYFPGAPLSGRVIVQNPRPALLESLRMELQGRVKSKVVRSSGNSRTTYRGRALLFKIVWKPGQPSMAPETGAAVYKFTSQIPERCMDTRQYSSSSGSYWDVWYPEGRFAGGFPGAPLPPACQRSPAVVFTDCRESYVSYRLFARGQAKADGVFSSGMLQSGVNLRVYPLPPAQLAEKTLHRINRFVVKTYRLIPENEERRLSFKERTKSMFGTSEVPKFGFSLQSLVPSQVAVGSRLPVEIRIQPSEEQSTCSTPPEIQIKNLSVEIKADTALRCRTWITETRSGWVDTALKTGPMQGDFAGFSKANEYSCKFFTAPLPYTLPPSFSSYNLALKYNVFVKYTLAIKDVTESEKDQFPIEIVSPLPPPADSEQSGVATAVAPTHYLADDAGPSSSVGWRSKENGDGEGEKEEEEEDLPSYQEATK